MESRRVLLVTYSAQGHINPSLQFASKLIDIGIEVTFVTTVNARRRMAKAVDGEATPKGLNFVAYSDGNDDGRGSKDDDTRYFNEMVKNGSKYLKELILSAKNSGRPFTCLVCSILLPWAAKVATEAQLPHALLWIQPAAVFDAYYYYFRGSYSDEITANCSDPSWKIQFPGIPLTFCKQDLPSFMVPSTSEQENISLSTFKEQFEVIESESKPKILVNTFDALESDALKSVEKYELIGIGPLIPLSENSISGDLFRKCNDYLEWLDEQDDSSVVYVSFGTMLTLSKQEKEEIARGLLDSGRPFLWVIRLDQETKPQEEEDKLSCMEELERAGKIVQWCSQMEVLKHPSVGCFVTHCGWNSTPESLFCGVPTVAVPRWSDQGTNAKMIEDLWKTGVRVKVGEDGYVKSDEIRDCIEKVMEEDELRKNGQKWKLLARQALEHGGSSSNNLQSFIQEITII